MKSREKGSHIVGHRKVKKNETGTIDNIKCKNFDKR